MKKTILEILSKFLKFIIIKLSNLENNLNPSSTELRSRDGKIKVRAIKCERDENFCDFRISRPIYKYGVGDYKFTFPRVIPDNQIGEIPLGVKKVLDQIYTSETCVWLSVQPDRIKIQKNSLLSWNDIIPRINLILISYLEDKNNQRFKNRVEYFGHPE
jgi:hypothetical protein